MPEPKGVGPIREGVLRHGISPNRACPLQASTLSRLTRALTRHSALHRLPHPRTHYPTSATALTCSPLNSTARWTCVGRHVARWVGLASCGFGVVWDWRHAGLASCGFGVVWVCVGLASCGLGVTWVLASCGIGVMWVWRHVGSASRGFWRRVGLASSRFGVVWVCVGLASCGFGVTSAWRHVGFARRGKRTAARGTRFCPQQESIPTPIPISIHARSRARTHAPAPARPPQWVARRSWRTAC